MKYQRLGRTGVYVSELCLGAMTFGSRFGVIGELEQKDADAMVGTSIDAGVNFFDTANAYSTGESEEILGKALASKRHDVVIATKVRSRMGPGPNEVGLSRLHIVQACEASLRRLGTDYIDLYQIHRGDPETDIEETLAALTDLVRAGKVRYIGCSNLAAWELMKALGVSERRGLERFCSTQSYYALVGRDLEYETIPLIEDQELALLVWGPLASGFLTGKFTREGARDRDARRNTVDLPPIDRDQAFDILDVMGPIANAHGASIAQVALAWLLAKRAVTSVIIGAKRMDQLVDNLGAVNVVLSNEEMVRLDEVSARPLPYPTWLDVFGDDRRPGRKRDFEELVKKPD